MTRDRMETGLQANSSVNPVGVAACPFGEKSAGEHGNAVEALASPQPPDSDHDPFSLADIPTDDTVGLYLKETAPLPLLSRDEELELARAVQRGRAAEKRLEGTGLSHAERESLSWEVEQAKLARERLILTNTRLVVSIAKRYRGRGVPFIDLIQEGNIGLMKTLEKYDHTRGFRFSTYATWWIRQCIARAVIDQGRTIRIPVHMSDAIRRMYKTVHQLQQEYDRRPTPEEIAREMGLKSHRVRWMLRLSRYPLSLDKPVGEDEQSELGQMIEDESVPAPDEVSGQRLLREEIEQVLDTLTAREARILRLRFGLHDGHSYTLEEVGRKFGLTRERIRQIERKALHRLRHPSRSRHLRGYRVGKG